MKIAKESLEAKKHVFIEKPFTNNSIDAEKLIKLASKNKRKLAVGHVFQFTPGVRKIKSLISSKVIGDVIHISSSRINLGPPQSEVDVIWDLGPHDFSIILYLLNESPVKLTCQKDSFIFNKNKKSGNKNKPHSGRLTNNAHIDLIFRRGTTAHIHLSWLSSNKMRLMQIFGTKGTIIYDEMLALDGKVKLYGMGLDNRIKTNDSDSALLKYQTGEIQVIPLEQHEPLRLECEHFIDAIINNKELINNGKIGLEVVKLLETSSESYKTN